MGGNFDASTAGVAAMPTRAMVFAAGLGTRMRPISDHTPKPLIAVGGKPMLDHLLDRFAAAGVTDAVVNLHYRADQIERHLAGRTHPRITLSDERAQLLDQAGGIVQALPQLGPAPFFICNTDAFWLEGPRSNLLALAARWDPAAMDILLLVAATTSSIGVDWPGDFLMGTDGRLQRRAEREVAPFVYSGIGIVKPELFQGTPTGPRRLSPYFFEAATRGRLFGQRLDGQWLHVGTPEAIGQAEEALAASIYF